MSLPKSLGLAAAFGLALALQAASGCGGAEFANDQPGGAGAGAPQLGDGGSEQAGAAGGTPGSGAPGTGGSLSPGCHGPEDCSDGDPCTLDACRKDGVCVLSQKCAADQKCCEGECGECCEDTDCNDGVSCTDDICFAGVCQHQPSPTSCGAGHYCSLTDDCVSLEPCSTANAAVCDDGSNCTVDDCQGDLCAHTFCSAATRCCPDTGCADECCTDQECNTDADPCTVGVCTAGKCSQTPRCGEREKCCPGADGGATCGSCCAAADCDDTIACTENACAGGKCEFKPNNKLCPLLQTCNAAKGCVLL